MSDITMSAILAPRVDAHWHEQAALDEAAEWERDPNADAARWLAHHDHEARLAWVRTLVGLLEWCR